MENYRKTKSINKENSPIYRDTDTPTITKMIITKEREKNMQQHDINVNTLRKTWKIKENKQQQSYV